MFVTRHVTQKEGGVLKPGVFVNIYQQKDQLGIESCGRKIVVSRYGGRITEFSFNGINALLSSGIQTGSTFWPSPQSLWGWPPPATLDAAPYRVLECQKSLLSLESALEESLGITLVKKIMPVSDGFTVHYSLKNQTHEVVTMAPWEISRVSGGLTFYESRFAPEKFSTCGIDRIGDCFWYDYHVTQLTGIPKIFANNTAGWLANVANGHLFLKTFPQVNSLEVAPMEAEVEIYAHADPLNPYVEIEQQGPFKAIMPGMSLNWSVDWRLFKLPRDVKVVKGSSDLLQFVNTQLGMALSAAV
ncbi:uncharacterized protein DUF4380 [Alteromonadaceae bacterium 2753L.S.0a.02]|nr:uncharacterized protein DUF4380 [Alteromonadaceae bacterium 2753L.S.0a.02]